MAHPTEVRWFSLDWSGLITQSSLRYGLKLINQWEKDTEAIQGKLEFRVEAIPIVKKKNEKNFSKDMEINKNRYRNKK